jgi:uncharacterized protein (DUF1684 family)
VKAGRCLSIIGNLRSSAPRSIATVARGANVAINNDFPDHALIQGIVGATYFHIERHQNLKPDSLAHFGGVFLPFVDATSGTETYGGGRYLLDTIKGADLGAVGSDGTLVLDFNFSYFPSCAYSSRYVCPLAPSGNRLSGAVRAGERHPISKA